MLEQKNAVAGAGLVAGATGWSNELSQRFMWLRSRVRVATAELM